MLGPLVNRPATTAASVATAVLIIGLNAFLVVRTFA
jgi:hypothetical protein